VKIGDPNSYEAFALLLFALKNWNAGKVEDAVALFRQFRAANPPALDAWVGELKPLVVRYMEDFTALEMGAEKLRAAKTPEKRAAAAEELQSKFPEPLATRAREIIAQVESTPLP